MQGVKRVVVTGASGNIAYSLLFRIASGEFLGQNQRIALHIHDLPFMEQKLMGVKMELDDCAFPLIDEIKVCTDYGAAFKDIDYAFMVGAKPRGPGMERGDLLKDNGKIFVDVGKALADNASRDCKTIVVGNPANTNCLICQNSAKGLPAENFTAMTRLDHNRALTQLAQRTGKATTDIENFTIWGNHSPTMFPDVSFAKIAGQEVKKYKECDEAWLKDTFVPVVQ